MATTARNVHPGAAIGLAMMLTLALVGPALARSGGNAAAAAACEDAGYLEWTDDAGNPFRNAGACTSYAAHGGGLVPIVVVVNPFAVTYRPAGSNGFVASVTGSGLEPDSSIDVFFSWGDVTLFTGNVADGTGTASFEVSGVCTSAGSPLTGVSVAGTPAGGEHAEYAVPLPDASICPPPA